MSYTSFDELHNLLCLSIISRRNNASISHVPIGKSIHPDNMSMWFIPPCTPLLYSKTGVYRGIHYFLIFSLKHRLWIFVSRVPTIYILSKNKKNITCLIWKSPFLQPGKIPVFCMDVLSQWNLWRSINHLVVNLEFWDLICVWMAHLWAIHSFLFIDNEISLKAEGDSLSFR